MGRYDFRPQRVLRTADQLLETKRTTQQPCWYNIVRDVPPSAMLTRPVFRDSSHSVTRRHANRRGKASKMFKPLKLTYEEDELRAEFFGDHPWELARPKVVLEDSAQEFKSWDWATGIKQKGKRVDGESVIQRQMYLMKSNGQMSKDHAYDIARKEFYKLRHLQAVEQRVAREEALSTGAYFGPGPLEVGELMEDAAFENWKAWAIGEVEKEKQLMGAAYTGNFDEEPEDAANEREAMLTGAETITATIGTTEGS